MIGIAIGIVVASLSKMERECKGSAFTGASSARSEESVKLS